MSNVAIRQVIESGYIEGIQLEQDEEKVRAAFHPKFRMPAPRGEEIAEVDVNGLLKLLVDWRASDPEAFARELTYKIDVLDEEATAAVVRVDLYRAGVHQFTDFLSLLKFESGWKIVSKIYCVQNWP